MIQLSSLMWTCAIFFAFVGFLRGWNRELVATAGIVLALFTVFQVDPILRGIFFVSLPREQLFLLELVFFLAVVFVIYQSRELSGGARRGGADDNWQTGILGGIVGFLNGYLISGSLWYLLDINEYPFSQFVTAPGVASPSAQSINSIPLVIIGGGASGTGDLLAIGVIALLFIVLLVF
jgi:hypothetical protein